MRRQVKPVTFKEVNGGLLGIDDIKDLPVYRSNGCVSSCWKIPFLKRLKILFTGCVYLVVMANTHPALYIDTELE